MKKLLVIILAAASLTLQGQSSYMKVSTHFNCEPIAQDIIKGRLTKHLKEEVDFTFEKRVGVFKTKLDASPDYVDSKVYKAFDKGDVEYLSRTNGGYTFTIAVINRRDDTKIIHYCAFMVDAFTGKIKEVEIAKGE